MTRVALVTGAARGIGAATVRGLAARGWAVLAVDRCADDPALPYLLGSRSQLDQVVAGASAAAGDPAAVRALAADVRDVVAMEAAVKEAERLWGGLDAAVAVAGVIAGGVPRSHGRRGRTDPVSGRRTRRNRDHCERGQSGLHRHADPG